MEEAHCSINQTSALLLPLRLRLRVVSPNPGVDKCYLYPGTATFNPIQSYPCLIFLFLTITYLRPVLVLRRAFNSSPPGGSLTQRIAIEYQCRLSADVQMADYVLRFAGRVEFGASARTPPLCFPSLQDSLTYRASPMVSFQSLTYLAASASLNRSSRYRPRTIALPNLRLALALAAIVKNQVSSIKYHYQTEIQLSNPPRLGATSTPPSLGASSSGNLTGHRTGSHAPQSSIRPSVFDSTARYPAGMWVYDTHRRPRGKCLRQVSIRDFLGLTVIIPPLQIVYSSTAVPQQKQYLRLSISSSAPFRSNTPGPSSKIRELLHPILIGSLDVDHWMLTVRDRFLPDSAVRVPLKNITPQAATISGSAMSLWIAHARFHFPEPPVRK
ncbi:hypothetical protein C8R44DRAFT_934069 [Mycena epipterygia]|nr:hypothetical protein C8R44DRAFT_934069 [Mycena epipterygia]